MRRTQGMRNLVFDVQEIINKPTDLDVWIVYKSEKDLENVYSLNQLLWKVSFDPEKVVKNYQMQHSTFYQILQQPDGTKQFAQLIL